MTAALIPAAGLSRRMGRPKLSLLWQGRPVLAHLLDALGSAGVRPILTVLAPHSAELIPIIEACGTDWLLLPDSTPDMLSTIRHGLAEMEHRYPPELRAAFLLIPADHPRTDPQVVRQLLAASGKIVVPRYGSRRGHPIRIDWSEVSGIRGIEPGRGLNHYLREHPDRVQEIEVAQESVLFDLDTPEDYARLTEAPPEGRDA